jgi:hypothetical protein
MLFGVEGVMIDSSDSDTDYDSDCDSVASNFDDNFTFSLTDPEEAYDYVKELLDNATAKQINSLIYVYLRPRPSSFRPRTQSGGSTTGDIDAIDGNLFRFLEFVDSAHDFVDRDNAEHMTKLLLQVLRLDPDTDFPRVFEDGRMKRLTLREVISHKTLLSKLTNTASLYFGDDKVGIESPLMGKDYRRTMFQKPSVEKVEFDDAEQKTKYLAALDTALDDHRAGYFEKKTDVQVALNFTCRDVTRLDDASNDDKIREIEEICQVCVEMVRSFGSNVSFMADSNKPMCTMLLSYSNIDAAVRKVLKQKVPRLTELIPQAWEILSCDACLADGASHLGVVHPKATGQVFHKDSLVKVEFKGCDSKGYRYMATSDTVSDTSRGFEEMGLEKVVVSGKAEGLGLLESYSVKKVLAELSRCFIRNKDGRVTGVKPLEETQWTARWLAMKRAGDWGQIEHCKNNGCVFATHDKPAFEFAAMRGVPALLLAEDATLKPTCGRVILSYVMHSNTAISQKLRSVREILEAYESGETQSGGGGIALQLALSVVVLAAAVVGSLSQ